MDTNCVFVAGNGTCGRFPQIQTGAETLWSDIHKLIDSIWNKEELPICGRSLLLYQFRRKAIKLTALIIMGYHCYQLLTKFYPVAFPQC
jgi:hypothetical protein